MLSIFIARIVIPDAYGIIAIISVLIDIFSVFINGGLGLALIQDENVEKQEFSSTFKFNLIFSCVMYAIIFAIAPYVAKFYKINEIVVVLRVYALALPLSCLYQIEMMYANKKLDFKSVFISSLIGVLLSGIISLILAILGFEIWALVVQYLLNIVITSVVLIIRNKYVPDIFYHINLSKKIYRFGFEITGAEFIATVFNSLNSLLIGKRYSTETLAYYDKGRYIPFLFDSNIAASITAVYFPVLSLEKDNEDKIVDIAKETTAIETFIMAPIYLGLIAVSKNMVEVLLTNKWIDSVPYIVIFSIAGLLSTIGPIDIDILKSKGNSNVVLYMELIKKPIWIILTIIAVRFNVTILAVVSAVMVLIETIINSYEIKKILKYSFADKIKIWIINILPSIPMFIFTMLLNNLNINKLLLLFIQLLVGIATFVLFSLITKNKNFVKIINMVKNKI